MSLPLEYNVTLPTVINLVNHRGYSLPMNL